jgi:hypothetical protein
MPTFARIDPQTSAIALVEITQAQFDALAGNPKRQFLRPLVVDGPPVPSATEVVSDGGYVIEPTQVRRTWALRAKTQAEIDATAQADELALLKQAISVLQVDIADGITAAPTTAAQAFVQIQDMKRRALRADRVLLWLLRQQG